MIYEYSRLRNVRITKEIKVMYRERTVKKKIDKGLWHSCVRSANLQLFNIFFIEKHFIR